MKSILLTGANGQLGSCIQDIAVNYPQYRFLFTDVDTLDICDRNKVIEYVQSNQVNYIINCAAYTAVDRAEEDEALCFRINRDAVANLGFAAGLTGTKVIHVSTDYVFNGTKFIPYIESDPTCPVSVYGISKLAGEKALTEACPDAAIVRTSWLYSEFGNNFVKTMLRLGNERGTLNVIFDQVGTPTYAGDLAEVLMAIILRDEEERFVPGIYHFSNEGVCSWYDFAVKIMELGGLNCKVSPIETKEYPTPAARPHYSVLNKTKIKMVYGLTIPHWESSLRRCYAKLTNV